MAGKDKREGAPFDILKQIGQNFEARIKDLQNEKKKQDEVLNKDRADFNAAGKALKDKRAKIEEGINQIQNQINSLKQAGEKQKTQVPPPIVEGAPDAPPLDASPMAPPLDAPPLAPPLDAPMAPSLDAPPMAPPLPVMPKEAKKNTSTAAKSQSEKGSQGAPKGNLMGDLKAKLQTAKLKKTQENIPVKPAGTRSQTPSNFLRAALQNRRGKVRDEDDEDDENSEKVNTQSQTTVQPEKSISEELEVRGIKKKLIELQKKLTELSVEPIIKQHLDQAYHELETLQQKLAAPENDGVITDINEGYKSINSVINQIKARDALKKSIEANEIERLRINDESKLLEENLQKLQAPLEEVEQQVKAVDAGFKKFSDAKEKIEKDRVAEKKAKQEQKLKSSATSDASSVPSAPGDVPTPPMAPELVSGAPDAPPLAVPPPPPDVPAAPTITSASNKGKVAPPTAATIQKGQVTTTPKVETIDFGAVQANAQKMANQREVKNFKDNIIKLIQDQHSPVRARLIPKLQSTKFNSIRAKGIDFNTLNAKAIETLDETEITELRKAYFDSKKEQEAHDNAVALEQEKVKRAKEAHENAVKLEQEKIKQAKNNIKGILMEVTNYQSKHFDALKKELGSESAKGLREALFDAQAFDKIYSQMKQDGSIDKILKAHEDGVKAELAEKKNLMQKTAEVDKKKEESALNVLNVLPELANNVKQLDDLVKAAISNVTQPQPVVPSSAPAAIVTPVKEVSPPAPSVPPELKVQAEKADVTTVPPAPTIPITAATTPPITPIAAAATPDIATPVPPTSEQKKKDEEAAAAPTSSDAMPKKEYERVITPKREEAPIQPDVPTSMKDGSAEEAERKGKEDSVKHDFVNQLLETDRKNRDEAARKNREEAERQEDVPPSKKDWSTVNLKTAATSTDRHFSPDTMTSATFAKKNDQEKAERKQKEEAERKEREDKTKEKEIEYEQIRQIHKAEGEKPEEKTDADKISQVRRTGTPAEMSSAPQPSVVTPSKGDQSKKIEFAVSTARPRPPADQPRPPADQPQPSKTDTPPPFDLTNLPRRATNVQAEAAKQAKLHDENRLSPLGSSPVKPVTMSDTAKHVSGDLQKALSSPIEQTLSGEHKKLFEDKIFVDSLLMSVKNALATYELEKQNDWRGHFGYWNKEIEISKEIIKYLDSKLDSLRTPINMTQNLLKQRMSEINMDEIKQKINNAKSEYEGRKGGVFDDDVFLKLLDNISNAIPTKIGSDQRTQPKPR